MRNRARGTAAVAASLTLALAVAGCAPEPAAGSHAVIAIAIAEPGAPLTPEHADDPIVARLLPAVTAGLVAPHPNGDVELELAESIETEDHTRFTITIAEGASFSDGEAVMPESFVESWRRIALASNELPGRAAFARFLGYSDEEDVDLVESGALEVLDETSFAVTLSRADPEFPRQLGRAVFLPLPSVAFEDRAAFEAHPVGAGPYMLAGTDAWLPGDRLELVPNPRYRGVREVRNSGLSFRFLPSPSVGLAELLAGEIDVVERLPDGTRDRLDELLDGRVVESALPRLESLVVPDNHPHFLGEEGLLRQRALALAIDREFMANDVLGGAAEPALGFLPASFDLQRIQVPWGARANDEAARAHWREANDLAAWEGALTIGVVAGGVEEELAEQLAIRFRTVFSINTVVARFTSADVLAAAVEAEELTAFTLQTTTASSGSVAAFLDAAVADHREPRAFRDQLTRASRTSTVESSIFSANLAQNTLVVALPIIPIWSPTVRSGFAAGIEGARLGWAGVLDYGLLSSVP